jgi:hypothetical protein
VLRSNSIKLQGAFLVLFLFLAAPGRATGQTGGTLPLNTLRQGSIEVNGIPFKDLADSQGDEGVIASLCQCSYTVLKSEDPDLPWAAYTLFEGDRRVSVSFGGDGSAAMGISNLELLGSDAAVTLNGVTLSRGDRINELGAVQSQKQYSGGSLHFALFTAGLSDSFFHIDFEPESGEIQKIGYLVPF